MREKGSECFTVTILPQIANIVFIPAYVLHLAKSRQEICFILRSLQSPKSLKKNHQFDTETATCAHTIKTHVKIVMEF